MVAEKVKVVAKEEQVVEVEEKAEKEEKEEEGKD